MTKKVSDKEIISRLQVGNLEMLDVFSRRNNKNKKMRYVRCKCMECENIFERQVTNINSCKGCPVCETERRGKKRRLGIEEAGRTFLKNGYMLLDKEYKNSSTRMTGIDSKGFKIYTTVNNLRNNNKPTIFDYRSPYCLENMDLWIKLNNKKFILLSKEICSARSKLKFKCTICSYEWETDRFAILNGSGCEVCGKKRMAELQRFTYNEIAEKMNKIHPDIELMSKEYIDCKSKLLCKCKIDGHIWSTSWNVLGQGCGCPKCAIKNRSGTNAYQWKGGISKLTNCLRAKLSSWKLDSLKKCNFKCDITGRGSEKIVHHLHSFNNILSETLDVLKIPAYENLNNYTIEELERITEVFLEIHSKYGLGVCLCRDEHEMFHKIYGKGNNTPEQYFEFKEMRLK